MNSQMGWGKAGCSQITVGVEFSQNDGHTFMSKIWKEIGEEVKVGGEKTEKERKAKQSSRFIPDCC